MIRDAIALVMLGGAMVLEPAFGQVVQYQFTPPPPVVPLPFQPHATTAPSAATAGAVQSLDVAAPVRFSERSARRSVWRRSAVMVPSETSRGARHHGKLAVIPYTPVPAPPAATSRLLNSERGTAAATPSASIPPPPPTVQYVPHHGSVVVVPPALVPGQDTYSDRASRCAQAGAAAGVGANQLGAFTTRCAQ